MAIPPIWQAIRAVGGQSALAREVGCTPQAVQKWCARNTIPSQRVLAVEQASGISREILRPDLYQPRNAAAA